RWDDAYNHQPGSLNGPEARDGSLGTTPRIEAGAPPPLQVRATYSSELERNAKFPYGSRMSSGSMKHKPSADTANSPCCSSILPATPGSAGRVRLGAERVWGAAAISF